MNYAKIYNSLIEKAKPRGLDKSQHEGYFEIHHIVPRSMGGSNAKDNLVMFTAREHFIAHMLLWKAFPQEPSLQRAAWVMSARGICKVNSKLYASAKAAQSLAVSEQMKGKLFKDLTGNRYERLVVVNIATPYVSPQGLSYTRWECECDCGNRTVVHASSLSSGTTRSCGCLAYEVRKSYAGKTYDEETKKKFRYLRGKDHPSYGKKYSPERVAKALDARRAVGYERSEESKLRYKLANERRTGELNPYYGIPRSQEVRDKISKANKAKNLQPWEVSRNLSYDGQSKWFLADYYYSIWEFFDKPSAKKFTKIYNEIHNDDIRYGSIAAMIYKFADGWVPTHDPRWVDFSEKFLEGECLKQ